MKTGSKNNSSAYRPSGLPEDFLNFSNQHGASPLKPLEPLAPLVFPTLAELASEQSATPSPSAKPSPLYSLIGDPAILLSDLLDDPRKYPDGADVLLQELVLGRKKVDELDAQEALLLNAAVITFVQAPRTPRKKAEVPRVREPEPEPEEEDLDEHGVPLPAADLTLPEAPTYWWRR
jgi:hypothetical protein